MKRNASVTSIPPITIQKSTVSRRSITRRSELDNPSLFAMSSSFVRTFYQINHHTARHINPSVSHCWYMSRFYIRDYKSTFSRLRCSPKSPSIDCDRLVKSETICEDLCKLSDS